MKKSGIVLIFILITAVPVCAQEKPVVGIQAGHASTVCSLAFSSDGAYALSGSWDNTLKFWQMPSGRLVRTFIGHAGFVTAAVFTPDNRFALSASFDKTVRLWDLQSGALVRTFTGHTDTVYAVAVSPDGKFALSGSSDATLKVWELATGKCISVIASTNGPVAGAAWSFDGTHLLSVASGVLTLWDRATGKEIWSVKGLAGLNFSFGASPLLFSRDGRFVLCIDNQNALTVREASSGKLVRAIKGHSGAITSIALSEDGGTALTGSIDMTVKTWDVEKGRQIRSVKLSKNVFAVALSPDAKFALAGFYIDCDIAMLEVGTGRELARMAGNSNKTMNGTAVSRDGRFAPAGAAKDALRLWDLNAGAAIRGNAGPTDGTTSLAFSQDGRLALSNGKDNAVLLWDAASGKIIKSMTGHTDSVRSLAFTHDGAYALSASNDKTIRIWETATGKTVRTLTGHTGYVMSMQLSPDGRRILTAASDNTARLWDIATGRELQCFSVDRRIYSAAFAPDERSVLVGDDDSTIRIWDIESGRETGRLKIPTNAGGSGNYLKFAFSSDGRFLVATSSNNEAKLLEWPSGRELKTFSGHAGLVYSAAFTPDNRRVLTASSDGSLRLWDAATGRELAQFVSFTDGEWIVMTPDGFYNASPGGGKYINVAVGMNVYGVEGYAAAFFRPDIVAARLAGR